jgi:hypothetical protein
MAHIEHPHDALSAFNTEYDSVRLEKKRAKVVLEVLVLASQSATFRHRLQRIELAIKAPKPLRGIYG